MNLKIIEKGKSYLLPFQGFIISGIDMRSFLGLELTPIGKHHPMFVIDINLNFELTRFNQKQVLSPNDTETIKKAIDLIGLKIKNAECYKSGDLCITLEDNTEIYVPDSQYESWHINTIRQERIKNTWVSGGVGQISCFDIENKTIHYNG